MKNSLTRITIYTIGLMFFVFSLSACYYDQADYLYPTALPCDTSNINYNQHIAPILTSNCTDEACHVTGAVFGGFKLDSYFEVLNSVQDNKLINSVKYLSGGAKNMPPTRRLTTCEIDKIEAWIRRGSPEN